MELTEPIENINRQLKDLFGIDTITGLPMYRIVWSEDQLEKRLMHFTDSGLQLLYPEVREVPKYRQWIQEKYVLENLTLIPDMHQAELPTSKLSYEPLWVFEGQNGYAVPPTLWASKFVIDTKNAAMGKTSLVKYVDEESKNPVETREARIDKLEEELFGDESFLLLRTVTGEAIAMPQSYGRIAQEKKEKE